MELTQFYGIQKLYISVPLRLKDVLKNVPLKYIHQYLVNLRFPSVRSYVNYTLESDITESWYGKDIP